MLGKGERPLAGPLGPLGRVGQGRRALGRFRRRTDHGLEGDREAQRKPIAKQVHTALDVLKVLWTVSAESYLENGVS